MIRWDEALEVTCKRIIMIWVLYSMGLRSFLHNINKFRTSYLKILAHWGRNMVKIMGVINLNQHIVITKGMYIKFEIEGRYLLEIHLWLQLPLKLFQDNQWPQSVSQLMLRNTNYYRTLIKFHIFCKKQLCLRSFRE